MKGTISISHNGCIIKQLVFTSEWNRNRIISQWRKQYGKGFKNAEISESITKPEIAEQIFDRSKNGFVKMK